MLLFLSTILYFLLLLIADCSSKAVQRCRLAGAGVNCRNLVTRETENEKMHFSFSLFSILDPGFHLQLDWILHITAYLHYTVQGAQYTVQVRPSLLFLTTFPPCRLCAHVRVSHSWALFSSCVSCQVRSRNCSQSRSISVTARGAVTPGGPAGETWSLSWGCVVMSPPSIHHRPYLGTRKCPLTYPS